jgi:hypothetical protein
MGDPVWLHDTMRHAPAENVKLLLVGRQCWQLKSQTGQQCPSDFA